MAPTIRPLQDGDAPQVAEVLHTCFGEMERWDEERVRELMGQSGPQASTWWLAADGSRVAGCIRVHALARPDAYVIRELAVRRRESAILDPLLGAALEYLAEARATLVRASTPDVPPYPEAYRRRGLVPVRRAVTLAWDLSASARQAPTPANVAVVDAARHPSAILAELYVEGMRPYWDWYIEERGGAAALKRRVADHFASGPGDDELWLVAKHDGEPVGLAGASELDQDEAVLEGVYVLPEHRGRGIGSALMYATLAGVSERARQLVVLETVTFLEGDTPSVRLYRRSGATLRAEYVHLQAELKRSRGDLRGRAALRRLPVTVASRTARGWTVQRLARSRYAGRRNASATECVIWVIAGSTRGAHSGAQAVGELHHPLAPARRLNRVRQGQPRELLISTVRRGRRAMGRTCPL